MAAEDYMLQCMNKKLFGLECFGCGTQRAFLLVLEGKFGEAFQLFPAVYTLMLLLAFVMLSLVDRKRNYSFFLIVLGIISGVLMVGSYFYRNNFFKLL